MQAFPSLNFLASSRSDETSNGTGAQVHSKLERILKTFHFLCTATLQESNFSAMVIGFMLVALEPAVSWFVLALLQNVHTDTEKEGRNFTNCPTFALTLTSEVCVICSFEVSDIPPPWLHGCLKAYFCAFCACSQPSGSSNLNVTLHFVCRRVRLRSKGGYAFITKHDVHCKKTVPHKVQSDSVGR